MSLVINTNIGASIVQKSLGSVQNGITQSLERLSTGLRINSASDDAAGLSQVTRLTSQIRGQEMAVKSVNDALGASRIAEDTLNEQFNILERLRELAVQGSNSTLSSTDRTSITDEVDDLLSELDRLATSVTYNDTVLLDGSYGTQTVQVGTNGTDTVNLSFQGSRIHELGQIAHDTSTSYRNGTPGTFSAILANDITINGVMIVAASSDGVSTSDASASAIAIATAVNALSATTGVYAKALDNVYTGTNDVAATTLTAGEFQINNINITGTVTDSASLASLVNAQTNLTGVTATTSGAKIVLQSADGRNIHVGIAGSGTLSGFSSNTVGISKVKLYSDSAFELKNWLPVGSTTTELMGIVGLGFDSLDPAEAINRIDLSSAGTANNAIDMVDNAMRQIQARRTKVGSFLNRFESTANTLNSTKESLSITRSAIQDVDIAKETADLTRLQVVQQAQTAALAQSNFSMQLVLSLFT